MERFRDGVPKIRRSDGFGRFVLKLDHGVSETVRYARRLSVPYGDVCHGSFCENLVVFLPAALVLELDARLVDGGDTRGVDESVAESRGAAVVEFEVDDVYVPVAFLEVLVSVADGVEIFSYCFVLIGDVVSVEDDALCVRLLEAHGVLVDVAHT